MRKLYLMKALSVIEQEIKSARNDERFYSLASLIEIKVLIKLVLEKM